MKPLSSRAAAIVAKLGRVADQGLPSGTVTFLFTDIEGSTRLVKHLREGYAQVLADHGRILREAAEAHEGREIDTQGDSFFFAFARANSALAAAVVAQRALVDHEGGERGQAERPVSRWAAFHGRGAART